MCVMKVIKNGHLSKEEIEKMWCDNPDGAGIGIIDINNNLLEPFKTKNLDELQDKLEEIFEKQEFNLVVVHFRNRSKGSHGLVNVNPIVLKNKAMFFHNGTIEYLNDEDLSDSNLFARDYLNTISDFDISEPSTLESIQNYLGSNISRMVFIQDGNPTPLIIDNSEKGYWNEDGNIWTSKKGY